MIKIIWQLLLFILPWKLRKWGLKHSFGFDLEEGSHIGMSIILAKKVHLHKNASIGHFNICKPIDNLSVGENSGIGNRNFITGFSVKNKIVLKHGHFAHIKDRKCELVVGEHVGITSRHYFDCNGGIYIGDYCQIAGFETAFLTHSIDLENNRQDARPIKIGKYTFVGTRVTFLRGSVIPPYSVVGACSMVNKQFPEPYSLYAGVPCKFIKLVNRYEFFNRETGFVK